MSNRRHLQPPTDPIRRGTHDPLTPTTSAKLFITVQNTTNTHNNRAPTPSSTTYTLKLRKQNNTMENDQPPSSSAPTGRRGIQRYRRGAHNVTLNASARLALTQHVDIKGRTQPPPASDPISLNINNYYTPPLGARRTLEAVLPPTHDRTYLSADSIYFHHTSAKEDLQHPLLLQPATPTLNSVIIESYYITCIYSTSTQNDNSFYIYIYLPNDYDNTTDVIEILTT